MTTPTTTATAPVGGMWSATQPGAKPAENEMGKDTFLKLLVAQMKYQDPMNPADGTEFIAQTAQFTVVEKLTEMAKQNEQLLASQQSMTASGLIGRDVSWDIDDGKGATVVKSGTVTGVSFTADGPTLRIGDENIALSKIKAVAPVLAPAPSAPAAPTEDTTASDATKPVTETEPAEETTAPETTAPEATTAPDETAPVAGSDPADTTDPAMDGTPTADDPSPAGTDPAI